MLPTSAATLHVRSTRVLLDGAPTTATVELEHRDGTWHVAAITTGVVDDARDIGDAPIVPAPLDLHFHGAAGTVVPPAGDPADIDRALAAAVEDAGWGAQGTTPAYEWLATLPVPTRPPADPVEHVAAAATLLAASPSRSRCAGIRLEGLFLNRSRAGVWPPETFRDPDAALLAELHAAAADCGASLRVVDVAPELPGALALVECAGELGIVASIAHTDATWEQARAAIDAGASLATHAWNAMRAVMHRDPGVVAAVLADERVTCELVCDGVHLHPGTIALSVAACGPGRWAAVSDASPFAGCPPGTYDWAGLSLQHDGVALRDDAGRLAGSASLLTAAPAVLREAGVGDIATLVALGASPRRVLDPQRPLGLAVGDPAWIAAVGPWADRIEAA